MDSVATDTLASLRAEGWRVAVHNDYRLNGEDWTFWLLTHPDGRYTKGEGRTDADALRFAACTRPIRADTLGVGREIRSLIDAVTGEGEALP